MIQPAIVVENVSKSYQLGDTQVDALRGVSLSIRAGEFVTLLGPSGSGKSTMLHLIGAMDRPSQGRVYLNGRDISNLSSSAQSELRLREIGFVFQTFNLIPTLTALENVALPMRLAGVSRAERNERSTSLLELVDLIDRRNHLPRQLSGGQRQRVAVARALANQPSLILADEPTGNLDSENGLAVMDLLRAANREGATVVLVTHNPELAGHADRVFNIRDGRLQETISANRENHAGEVATTI